MGYVKGFTSFLFMFNRRFKNLRPKEIFKFADIFYVGKWNFNKH